MEVLQSAWRSFMDAPDYMDYSPLFPNPLICVRDMVSMGLYQFHSRLPWDGIGIWWEESWEWLGMCLPNLDAMILLMPLLVAVLLTVLRMALNYIIFKRIPVKYKLDAEAQEKFPESIWKCLVYTVTWSWAIYLVATKRYFYDLQSHWINHGMITWYPREPIDPLLTWLYVVQIAFYLHCAYASVFIETIRRDFVILMLHHFLTIGLLLFSYVVRFHRIGLLVLFFQDIGDICLELAKCFNYFKVQDGKEKWLPEMGANVTFGIFTLQHVLFRLYWYPTKVIYSAMYVSVTLCMSGPFYLVFVPMLLALYAMQVYWFKFILRLLYKILILGEKVQDTREFDEEEEGKLKENGETKPKVKANGPGQDGDVRKRPTAKRED